MICFQKRLWLIGKMKRIFSLQRMIVISWGGLLAGKKLTRDYPSCIKYSPSFPSRANSFFFNIGISITLRPATSMLLVWSVPEIRIWRKSREELSWGLSRFPSNDDDSSARCVDNASKWSRWIWTLDVVLHSSQWSYHMGLYNAGVEVVVMSCYSSAVSASITI